MDAMTWKDTCVCTVPACFLDMTAAEYTSFLLSVHLDLSGKAMERVAPENKECKRVD